MTTSELTADGAPTTTTRPTLSRPQAFRFIGALLAVFLMASTAPTPMYAIYQQRWDFSATVLTEVFAAYMVGILAALVLFGGLSDRIGRRPVLLAAVTTEIVSLAVLAFAPGVGWLFLGRTLQGLATGAATSAISGSLLDFQRSGTSRGATINAVAAGAGMALGSAAAGTLVQFAPLPTMLSYFVLIAGFVLAIPLLRAMPEPVRVTHRLRSALRPQRPTVPRGKGKVFALLATTMLATWSIGGAVMSLGPSIATSLTGSDSHLVGGLVVGAVTGTGALAQLALSGWSGQRSTRVGSGLLIIGLCGLAASVLVSSAALLFTGAVVLGIGWGLVFMGGFRLMTALADPDSRASTASMIYVVAYLSSAVPSVCLGVLTTHIGLAGSTLVFTAVAALFAVAAWISTHVRA